MDVRWDSAKAASNLRKHGIHFSDAEAVLYDSVAVTVEDRRAVGEQRFVTVGADALGRIIVVVYAYREESFRLISARRATGNERRAYEEGV
jgi:uncharacterized DUF497 family protein